MNGYNQTHILIPIQMTLHQNQHLSMIIAVKIVNKKKGIKVLVPISFRLKLTFKFKIYYLFIE
jgi:hypothetical protein